MLKQPLLKFLNKDIELIKDQAYKQGHCDGGNHFYREQNAERLRVKELVMAANIGEKVIYTSNEWEDPVFAIIEDLETFHNVDGPMYKGTNVLTNETVYFFEGTVYLADEKDGGLHPQARSFRAMEHKGFQNLPWGPCVE